MTIFGPDLSHYQAGFNFAKAASEGAQFVIGKISQGSSYKDTQWPKTRDQARAAGMLVVGYHYVTGDNPNAQAATCASWIGDKSIPVALDWEANGGNFNNLKAVAGAFRSAGLNLRLVYTGTWYWQQVGSPDMSSLGLPLWKSRYPSTNPGSPSSLYAKVPANYWAGLGGLETKLLQFTDHASIAGMSTDCSAFQGTRADLEALLGVGPAPAPQQQETDMTDDDRKMLQEVHFMLSKLFWPQLAGADADPFDPDKMFTGWEPRTGKAGERRTLVDWCRTTDEPPTA